MADHLPNPYVPGAKLNPKPVPATKSTLIKLWNGGEHRNAKALATKLKLSDADLAEVVASCPGWND